MPANKDDGGWKKFLWNSEKGELMGRTGSSWFKITLFYVVFYGCLAGVFIGTIQAMLLTLNDFKPTWQDRVAPPGLSHTPKVDKAEVSYSINSYETYMPFTKALREFVSQYDDANQGDQSKFDDCGRKYSFNVSPGIWRDPDRANHPLLPPEEPAEYKLRGDLDDNAGVRKACRFSRKWLGPCSGLEDESFGFKEGKPCIIVKLNRIVNFRPRPPSSNDSIPPEAAPKVQPNVIPLFCTNKREEDAGKIGEIKYYGIGGGFPLQYYPYYGKRLHPQYLQPLVAVQFANLTQNEELRIECKVFGENIDYNEKDRYQGRFDLKITINNV
ncbi:Sodium/potassium-transporting ATPase subunit beta-233 [Oryzias melastigma]|uniref:Sodium/potassium-transporting ATPase subunit beta n=1 Tax=Oryzias melastigma TaxID=30732 RepID=A0A834CAT4_ORYME|nr:Sodium/potassium-transporting ATPase subunit beta-233 [Oryzias melastigma]